MRLVSIALFMLLLSGLAFSQVTTEGGNVTELNLSGELNSTYWDGVYGEVVLGAGVNYSHVVNGNNIVRINMVAQDPNCTHGYINLIMHVIAVNDTAITAPLAIGNLPVLDAFIGGGTEDGTNTFTLTSTFYLTYGTFNNVPTVYTYANNASSTDFREGYLNDAAGNLVFVTEVVDNRPDWNGSTSDYQIMLPNNGSPINYTLWVDVNYTCAPSGPGPGPGKKEHKLYIYPPGVYEVGVGKTFNPTFLIENRGDFVERDILVYIQSCPAGFMCGSGNISRIGIGDQESAVFPITVNGKGEYILTVCAENVDVLECRDFIVRVTAECESDEECEEDEYCEDGVCKKKEKVLCETDDDCAFDEICVDGLCEKIECICGYIENHTCIEYECCADEDCEDDEFCIEHVCVPKELDIVVVEGEAIEGEDLLVKIINNKGEEVPFADVFTNYMRVTADENGYATIEVPYDGLIYGYKDGYPQAGILLDVVKLGFFIAEDVIVAGQETTIQVVDSKGHGIPDVRVHFDSEVIFTDEGGYFYYTFDTPGNIILEGEKDRYIIEDKEINVVGIEEAAVCQFPVILNWFMFTPDSLYTLWILSILLAVLNFALFTRRIKAKRITKGLLYSFGPLVLALPGISIFSICFMTNIVVLQAIIEGAMLVRRLRGKKKK